MERPTHKIVNGVSVELTQEEADAIWNEWQANLADISAYKDDIDRRVQQLLDDTAKLYRYDNMQQVTQFATVDNEFNAEAVSLLAWNATIWELTEAHIANVTEIPTFDFIATLPSYGGN
jgi:hypothetical protein